LWHINLVSSLFDYLSKKNSLRVKKLIIKILAWILYIIVSLVLWFIGNLLLLFDAYGVFKDSTDEEWARFHQGELIYTIIAIVLFMVGGILLHLFLKKKLK
jgi:hypothetical protein